MADFGNIWQLLSNIMRTAMIRRWLARCFLSSVTLLLFAGCEKNINISLPSGSPQLVVEAYINNEIPEYNYVILSRSQTLDNADIRSIPVKNALVKITAGDVQSNRTVRWDSNSTVVLREVAIPGAPESISDGVYTDPVLHSSPEQALHGETGKYYLLEIEVDGKYYTAVTTLLPPIPISLSTGFQYTETDGIEKGRITVLFNDPDTTGNCQLFYWRHGGNRNSFGWGSLGTSKRITNSDETNNGDYTNITNSYGYVKGDHITCYMAHVTRDVYNFWDSYNKARSSGNLLSTPASLQNNISGENVTGCFSGLSISSATIVMD